MREASAHFTGMRDFAAFTDDDPAEKSTRVLLETLEIVEDGALILVRVAGSHFLWKMVRRIVGVLVAVGRGEITVAQAEALLHDGDAQRQVSAAALTAPAAGLFLEGVYYDGDAGPGPLRPAFPVA